jgi:hypothetical protein
MAMVSQRDASKALKKAEAADKRMARVRERNKLAIEGATRTAVTMGGAFGMAWWQGRYPDKNEILGMDASLVVGGALTVAAMMGWAGSQDVIVESLGTGALAVYAATKGFAMGKDQAESA